jgi:multiple sugar transport system substrate-binding protein
VSVPWDSPSRRREFVVVGSRQALVALLAGGALVVAGCSGGDPSATKTTTAAPSGPTLLTFEVYGAPQVVTAYAKVAAQFSSDHPDTVVNVRPYDTSAAAGKALEEQIAAGNPPDAFLAPLEALPSLEDQKAIQPVDELLGEREVDFGDGYQRYSLEAFSSDNRLQCMPVDVSPLVVYYNTDLIDLAQPIPPTGTIVTPTDGWTLSQFADAARAASGRGVRGLYVSPTLQQVAPFLWSGGGDLVDDDENPKTLRLSDGGSESALEKLLEVVRNPQITFNDKQLARKSALERFKGGSLAMMFGFRSLMPQLRAQQNLHFDVMPLPRIGKRVTVGQSSGLCLSAASENEKKAADFIAYAVSDDASKLLADTGYTVPTNLDVVNSDAFTQPGEQPLNAAVFPGNVRYIQTFPTVTTWSTVDTEMTSLLTGLFNDPVIDPFDERLKAIDAASVPLFTPLPTPSPTGSPTASPSAN